MKTVIRVVLVLAAVVIVLIVVGVITNHSNRRRDGVNWMELSRVISRLDAVNAKYSYLTALRNAVDDSNQASVTAYEEAVKPFNQEVLATLTVAPPKDITLQDYMAIESGSTYFHMANKFFSTGIKLSDAGLPGTPFTVMWTNVNANGAVVYGTFQNDRLVQKSQVGLQ
jgi:hypothetical protein